jgi:hypothetical protein
MIGVNAQAERRQIVRHIKEAAARILCAGIQNPVQIDLKIAELVATALEEAAGAIEDGDHWRSFDD